MFPNTLKYLLTSETHSLFRGSFHFLLNVHIPRNVTFDIAMSNQHIAIIQMY